LLLITNRKSHIGFQITQKSLTLDDLEGQYCNKNCIGCSASLVSTAGLFLLYLSQCCSSGSDFPLDKLKMCASTIQTRSQTFSKGLDF